MTAENSPQISAGRRWLRRLLIAALLFAAFYQLAAFLLNRSLHSALADHRGPSLVFKDHLPSPLPASSPNGWDAVEAAELLLEGQTAIRPLVGASQPEVDPGLQQVYKRFRVLDPQRERPGGADLELFRATLARFELPLHVLDRGLAEAPEARYFTDYNVAPPAVEVPNFLATLRLTGLLRARIELALAEGRSAEAWRDATSLYRLAYWSGTSTNTLIGVLISRAISRQGDLAVQTLLGRAPADAATRALTLAEARRLEPQTLFDEAFAAETAAMYSALLDARFTAEELEFTGDPENTRFSSPVVLLHGWRPWRNFNAAHYLRWSARTGATCALPTYRQGADGDGQFAAPTFPEWIQPAASLVFDCLGASSKRDLMQASQDQLEIALALESYRELAGTYPPTLAAAGGNLTAKIDPFSGKSYRYLAEAGGYRLYSVSANRQDDGGRQILGTDGQVDFESGGDWVWQVAGAPSP